MNSSHDIRQRDARTLAEGYSPGIRRLELTSIIVFAGVMAVLWYRLAPYVPQNPWLFVTAATLGYMGADLVSGFVHWMADTWGSVDMPVIGKALIRPFREHHVDQEAITRHDFVETNGNNCLISLGPAVGALLIPIGPDQKLGLFTAVFIGSLVIWVFGTNQFHKWAHMKTPPRLVALLQRMHLILPPAHHAIHHTAPFNRYYSITVGWMNWPLTVTHFYPMLEALVTWVSGALPRQDDIGERAAREVAELHEEELPSASAEAPKLS